MSPDEEIALLILGMVTSSVAERFDAEADQESPARSCEPMQPFVEPLERALTKFGEEMTLPTFLKRNSLDASQAFGIYHSLLYETHPDIPRNFFTRLCAEISKEEAVSEVISFLRSIEPDKATTESGNSVLAAIFAYVIPIIKNNLHTYIEHHVNRTLGFREYENLFSDPNSSVMEPDRQRENISRHLLYYVMGFGNAEIEGPLYPKNPLERSKEPRNKGKKRISIIAWSNSGGWQAKDRQFKNELSDLLLGPIKPGSNPYSRRSGSLISGLIHRYFAKIKGYEFHRDANVAYTLCPTTASHQLQNVPDRSTLDKQKSQRPILFRVARKGIITEIDVTSDEVLVFAEESSDNVQFTCSHCGEVIDHVRHKVDLRRKTIAGIRPGAVEPHNPLWGVWHLYECQNEPPLYFPIEWLTAVPLDGIGSTNSGNVDETPDPAIEIADALEPYVQSLLRTKMFLSTVTKVLVISQESLSVKMASQLAASLLLNWQESRKDPREFSENSFVKSLYDTHIQNTAPNNFSNQHEMCKQIIQHIIEPMLKHVEDQHEIREDTQPKPER